MSKKGAKQPTQHNADGTFASGHTLTTHHGGEGAIKHLQHGKPLVGIAAELKEQVAQEIEENGIVAVMRERAERHQAVADLFYGLLLGTTEAEPLDQLVRRFGWMNSKAFGMMREIAELESRAGGNVLDYEVWLEQQGKSDGV